MMHIKRVQGPRGGGGEDGRRLEELMLAFGEIVEVLPRQLTDGPLWIGGVRSGLALGRSDIFALAGMRTCLLAEGPLDAQRAKKSV